jgi:hypothetical protein
MTRSRLCLLLAAAAATSGCIRRMGIPGGPPPDDPRPAWKEVLKEAVGPRGVHYDYIEERMDVLQDYLAWLAIHGPNMDSMRESAEDKRIAFMANAYNAAVIYSVLRNPGVDSVQEIGADRFPWGLREGAGFYVGQEFLIDGSWQTLLMLKQQDIIGRYQEPLVHVTLSEGAKGSPPVRYWEGRRLTATMRRHMRRWLLSDHGMRWVDDGYAVNEIFFWNEAEFIDWSKAETLCDYLVDYTAGDRKEWLDEHSEDCPLGVLPYDWSLNSAPSAPGPRPTDAPPDDEDLEDEDDEGLDEEDDEQGDDDEGLP